MIGMEEDVNPRPILPIKLKNIDVNKLQSITTSLENISAEEFLSFVHLEASVLPNVLNANRATINIPNRQNVYIPHEESRIPECPEDYLPSSLWENECIEVFELLRDTIQKLANIEKYKERLIALPAMKDEKNWMTFCLGIKHGSDYNHNDNNEEKKNNVKKAADVTTCDYYDESNQMEDNDNDDDDDDEDEDEDEDDIPTLLKRKRAELDDDSKTERVVNNSNKIQKHDESMENDVQANTPVKEWSHHTPTLRLLLQMDQVMCQTLLRHHISWLEHNIPTNNRTQWLYALLAQSEEPFNEATVAALRQLYRRCCRLRANIDLSSSPSVGDPQATTISNSNNDTIKEEKGQEKHKGKEVEEPEESQNDMLAQLNLLIVLTGRYFKQGEYYANFT